MRQISSDIEQRIAAVVAEAEQLMQPREAAYVPPKAKTPRLDSATIQATTTV